MMYTAGPWKVGKYRRIFADDGSLVAETFSWPNWANADANAELIVAAPDMLEALRKAEIGLVLSKPLPGYDMQTLSTVRSAIAKAEGR